MDLHPDDTDTTRALFVKSGMQETEAVSYKLHNISFNFKKASLSFGIDAFELAGVPVLLCTLWSVDDFATALFMETFYGELHASGKPLQALSNAKRIIRTLTYTDLEGRGFASQAEALYERHMALAKEEKPFGHPRYWAGFVLHGAVL